MTRCLYLLLLSVALCSASYADVSTCGQSIQALLQKVIPSVVAIHTQRIDPERRVSRKQRMATSVLRAEGSGFIVRQDGFIATNRHVVSGAYDVTATLSDGSTHPAKVVWESPVVDVAFVKVDVGHPLPAIVFAADGAVHLGERVVAVGNPLGLGFSVSAGIVSALDRNIKESPYDDFIQTDAAVNHGSSGGPLFNTAGEVIGMNSSLYSEVKNGGSQGLGFAIPSSHLSFLMDELNRDGRIECGTLGLRTQKLTATMADGIGFPGGTGVIVSRLDKGMPAANAGVRVRDVIRSFNGEALHDVTTLNRLSCMSLDKKVKLGLWREGRAIEVSTAQALFSEPHSGWNDVPLIERPRFASAADLGLELKPVNNTLRRRYGMLPSTSGFLVQAVADWGEGAEAGLQVDDVLTDLPSSGLSRNASFDDDLAALARRGREYVVVLAHNSSGQRWVVLPIHAAGAAH